MSEARKINFLRAFYFMYFFVKKRKNMLLHFVHLLSSQSLL